MVNSFAELISTRFGDGINALCWTRTLPGNFGEIAELLGVAAGIVTVEDARLQSLTLSQEGNDARHILLQDQALLRAHGLSPGLDCIHGHQPKSPSESLPTHVQSWHVDSADVEADTWLCTYCGPSSEALPNEEAQRRVDVPKDRAELLKLYGGQDDDGFLDYLNEHFHDLHYVALPQARPISFGLGNLWRIACAYPGSPVPPCIHRAPVTLPGQPPRLLLIS